MDDYVTEKLLWEFFLVTPAFAGMTNERSVYDGHKKTRG